MALPLATRYLQRNDRRLPSGMGSGPITRHLAARPLAAEAGCVMTAGVLRCQRRSRRHADLDVLTKGIECCGEQPLEGRPLGPRYCRIRQNVGVGILEWARRFPTPLSPAGPSAREPSGPHRSPRSGPPPAGPPDPGAGPKLRVELRGRCLEQVPGLGNLMGIVVGRPRTTVSPSTDLSRPQPRARPPAARAPVTARRPLQYMGTKMYGPPRSAPTAGDDVST